jgi:hypothetical protein
MDAKTQEPLTVETLSASMKPSPLRTLPNGVPRSTTGGKTLPTMLSVHREKGLVEEQAKSEKQQPTTRSSSSKPSLSDKVEKNKKKNQKKNNNKKSVMKKNQHNNDQKKSNNHQVQGVQKASEKKRPKKRTKKSASASDASCSQRVFANLLDKNVRKLVRRLDPKDSQSIAVLIKCADIIYCNSEDCDERERHRVVRYIENFKRIEPKAPPKKTAVKKPLAQSDKQKLEESIGNILKLIPEEKLRQLVQQGQEASEDKMMSSDESQESHEDAEELDDLEELEEHILEQDEQTQAPECEGAEGELSQEDASLAAEAEGAEDQDVGQDEK